MSLLRKCFTFLTKSILRLILKIDILISSGGMGLWFTELQNRISSSEISSESICTILQTKAVPIVSNDTDVGNVTVVDVRIMLFNLRFR